MSVMVITRVLIAKSELPPQSYNDQIYYDNEAFVNATMIHYPFMSDPANKLNMTQIIKMETNKTSFLGQYGQIRLEFMPLNCIRYKNKRQLFAVWPRDEFTVAFSYELSQWSKI